MKLFASILLISGVILLADSGSAQPNRQVRVMTLNLHGYHPMGEMARWKEDRSGHLSKLPPNLFFFTPEEIFRGNQKRLDVLAADIRQIQPDFLLLQEVTAGVPDDPKDCTVFEANPDEDSPGKNTALRLCDRLATQGYRAALACRNNKGWWTGPESFKEGRIVVVSNGQKRIIWDFGANPYPNALLVEGSAILYRDSWLLETNQSWNLPYNEAGHEFALQVATFRSAIDAHPESPDNGAPWILIANLHGGHGIEHFEEAVAVRAALTEYVVKHPDRPAFRGMIIGGDFNANLYRPATPAKHPMPPLSAPWEVAVPEQYDLRIGVQPVSEMNWLQEALAAHNAMRVKRGVRGIANAAEAQRRISQACSNFFLWQQRSIETGMSRVLTESLSEANRTGTCRPDSRFSHTATSLEYRIDHLFADSHFKTLNAYVLYTNCYHLNSLETVSDHPGIVSELEWPMPQETAVKH